MQRFLVYHLLLSVLSSAPTVRGQKPADPVSREYHVPQGGSKALNCSQSGAPDLATWWNVTWVLPNLTLLHGDPRDPFEVESGTVFTLSTDGQLLHVDNLQPDWYGEYYCIVLHAPFAFYVTRFGLNTSYYYAAELWEEYRHMLILLGVVTGTVLALITLFFSLLFWCRSSRRRAPERPPGPPASQRATSPPPTADPASKDSVWEEYLGPSVIYPGSDKTL